MNDYNEQLLNIQEDKSEIDLYELFTFFLSKWKWILIGIVAGAILSGCYTFFMITPKYTATSKLYMVSSSNDSVVDLTDLNIGTSLSSDYAELLKVRPVLEEIIEDHNLPYQYEELSSMINISPISDTRILMIKVSSTSPKEAKTIANALAKKAVKEIPKLMDTSKPNIAEEAIVPKSKSSPNLMQNTLIGAFLGMLVVLAIYTILFIADDTLNSSEDIEKAFGILPIAVIPEGKLNTENAENTNSLFSLSFNEKGEKS